MRESMRDIMAGVYHDATPKPKLVANNTVEYFRDGVRVIRLHQTDILEFRDGGKLVWLNSGGWQTVTTKDRFNHFLPAGLRVYSDKGKWRLHNTLSSHWTDRGPSTAYVDGMIARQIKGAWKLPSNERAEKAQDKLASLIRKFVNKLDKLDTLPAPSTGDCWYCLMFDRPDHTPAGPIGLGGAGSKSKDPEHILSHVKEGYLHGSLLRNAFVWAGWTEFRIALAFQPGAKKDWNAKATLRRYLKAQLGLPV